ncbi:hypothetical protein ACFW9O_33270 [Streptomyces sp. NPDC059499]|uniref:hypothetical protein n=1 Tax=Streptomyces sp. NPDC059499 TaxID=3346852 RepID=UPI003693A46B
MIRRHRIPADARWETAESPEETTREAGEFSELVAERQADMLVRLGSGLGKRS